MTNPVLAIDPLPLPRYDNHHDQLWTTLCDLADAHPSDWTLIGGQMVLLHSLQARRDPGRVSQDLDAVIDARVRPPALPQFIKTLHQLGFEATDVSPDEIAHRFQRNDIHIDVLGPDGLGPRTDLRTRGRATTIEVSGGTQALHRTERVPVSHGARTALVPRPNLLGAITIKAAAASNDPYPQRHLRDLAFLCSLIETPDLVRAEMSPKDSERLRSVTALNDRTHEAWQLLDDATVGFLAFRLLTR